MADNVDDTRNFIEKSNSSSSLSLNPADSVQINSNQQLDDAEYINNTIDRENILCLLAASRASTQRNDVQNKNEKRQLLIAMTLCFFFMFCEIVGGYLAGSLAIMSDAAHLLSDCISFIVSFLAIVLAKKSPDSYMTFGYKRIEVLGAILSIFGIWLLTTFLFYFALNRLIYQDFDIDADTMMIVSALGIVINILMALILHGDGIWCFKHVRRHHHHSCNSHTPKHDQTFHNNNKAKFEYKPLIEDPSDKRNRSNNVRTNRSPNPSRNKPFNSHSSSNGSDMMRRNSHATINLTTTSTSIKFKNIIDMQHTDCNIDLNHDDKVPTFNSRDIINNVRGCISNGSAICPIHHYMHRDSSEHTPITSSDSEDLHEHRLSRNFISHHQLNSNHSHDFSSKNINIQAAVIHVVGDFIQSIGVFISAIIIKNYPNAKIADPLCTFVFSIIVMMTTCSIMKDSISVILEAVPNSINTERLSEDLNCIDGVRSIHNLNVWSLTVGWNVMSVHIIIDPIVRSSDVLDIATTIIQKGYNIKQCTIQIEECRELESDHLHNNSLDRPNSIASNNDSSIINILS